MIPDTSYVTTVDAGSQMHGPGFPHNLFGRQPGTAISVVTDDQATHQTKEHGNQDHWHSALQGQTIGANGLLSAFGEPRYQVLHRIEHAGLAHPRWTVTSLEDFLASPETFIDAVHSKEFHLFIEPAEGVNAARLRYKNVELAEALKIAAALEALPDKARFVATIVESPKLLYHGNILVFEPNDSKVDFFSLQPRIIGEFVRGDSLPVSRAGTVPEFRFWQDPYTETLRYDTEDPEIRRALFNALRQLPTTESDAAYDGFRKQQLSGYYEVGIAEGDNGGAPRTYLYDMKGWGAK